ncbi:hypothetical protein MRB53_039751 [Persea americana]|nr:hypothetical protein MRB53_039751 [Persea americana]
MAINVMAMNLAELEEEELYQQVLIDSLDSTDEFADDRRTELETTLDAIRTRISELENGIEQTVHSANTTPSSTASSSVAGMKRSAPSSFSSNDAPYKRQTPSPLPTQSFNPRASQDRARMRQQEIQARIQKQVEQSRSDEQYARSISAHNAAAGPSQSNRSSSFTSSQQSSRPVYQATLNPNGAIQAPPRPAPVTAPAVPVYGSAAMPSIKPEYRPSSSLPHRPSDNELVDLTGDSDEERPTASTSARPLSYPNQPPSYAVGSSPYSTPGGTSRMPGSFPQTDSRPPYAFPTQQTPQSVYRPLPLAHHQPGYAAPQNVYSSTAIPGYQPMVGPGPASRPPLPPSWQSNIPQPLQSFANMTGARISKIASELSDPMRSLPSLMPGIPGSNYSPFGVGDDDDDDDEITYNGMRRINPYGAGSSGMYAGQSDLYRSRFEMLEEYNPEKTKEELNALLNNIRPDEDMPDDLLVRTPTAMAVKLHKYQELGLTWLKKCEEGTNKGGILADDMGLGKTIQMLSLMVTRRSTDPRCKTTLIVAPVALLRQWKQEAEQRVKRGQHSLSVYIHHGQKKKVDARDLQHFDIVLTTFGSLAAELKRLEKYQLRVSQGGNATPLKDETCALLGSQNSQIKWYRVILDEAQCIKNRNTQSAKAACMLNAEHRWCVTGTPMMNNVDELYSLIKFLRIKPYNRWEKFRADISLPLKSGDAEQTMRMLQALCKAIMLRRTKKSEYQGRPILILPERTTEIVHATFDEHESEFYKALEQRTAITFNKYLKAGTVGRSYSAILVLLLRLRQACCHPHLIKDFSIGAAADLSETQLLDLARELSDSVVNRIKETGGNFECPVCLDACENPAIFLPCGHFTCRDCYVKLADPNAALQEGNERVVKARCPECRGDIDPKRITDFMSFKQVHMPELLTEEEKAQLVIGDDEDETESEDSETESEEEDDADHTLGGFIVNDEEEEVEDDEETEDEKVKDEDSETESEAEEEVVTSSKKKGKRPVKTAAKPKKKPTKKKGKGKEKAKKTNKLSLAELKKQSTRNLKAKAKYIKRLRQDYEDSAKIRKLMEILDEVMNNAEGEKVLVFSQWTSLLDLCEVEISGRDWVYRRYDGSMNAVMRADAVDDFKDASKNVRIMMVSLKAGNAGLNLNVASQVVILDPFWNPYVEEQAIDRAHRIGQTRPVQIRRVLVEGTVEDRICELQEKKRKLISEALDEKRATALSRLGQRELAYLFGVSRHLT